MRVRSLLAVVSIGLAAASVARPAAQALRAAAPYVVLSADGRTAVAAVTAGDQEMLRLDELAALLQVTVREDRAAKALTVSRGTSVVVLSLDQGLASIGGKIVSLAAAPVRDGSRWLVSPDTVNRALAPIAGVRVEVRRASRLIVLGDLRVPRITVQQESGGPPTRLAIDVAPRAAYTIVQEPRRLLVRFDADALDVGPTSASGGLVQSVTSADPATLVIALDRNVGTFGAATVPVDAATSRIVIDLTAAGAPAQATSGLARAQPPPPPIPAAPPPAAVAKPEAVPMLPAAQPPGVRTVVIDPGHGGDELGTQGAGGMFEKDLVLDVARRLRTVLDRRLGIRVLLTRDDDRIVPHDERASMANNNKADLFISLHANASPSQERQGRGGVLPQPRRARRRGAQDGGEPRDQARPGARRRVARHRPDPVGHGPGPAPERVGVVRHACRGGAARGASRWARTPSSRRRSACWSRRTCRPCSSKWGSSATRSRKRS